MEENIECLPVLAYPSFINHLMREQYSTSLHKGEWKKQLIIFGKKEKYFASKEMNQSDIELHAHY